MQVRIELLEDAFWGSGESIPGAEDSSILMDEHGFPYLRGTTFRGVLREEMENYFAWTGQENADSETEALFGSGGMRPEEVLLLQAASACISSCLPSLKP